MEIIRIYVNYRRTQVFLIYADCTYISKENRHAFIKDDIFLSKQLHTSQCWYMYLEKILPFISFSTDIDYLKVCIQNGSKGNYTMALK